MMLSISSAVVHIPLMGLRTVSSRISPMLTKAPSSVVEASLMADVDIKEVLFRFSRHMESSTPMGWLESSMMRWTVMMYTQDDVHRH